MLARCWQSDFERMKKQNAMIVAVPMKNRVSPQLCMYVGSAQNFSTIGRVRNQFLRRQFCVDMFRCHWKCWYPESLVRLNL